MPTNHRARACPARATNGAATQSEGEHDRENRRRLEAREPDLTSTYPAPEKDWLSG